MSADFIDTYKQKSTPFPVSQEGQTSELVCNILELEDKLVVNLSLNGETDVTYDLQLDTLNKKPITPNHIRDLDLDDEVYGEDELNELNDIKNQIIPVVLIGDASNLKSQVMASELGKLLNQFTQKNVILSSSGKLWRQKPSNLASSSSASDFEKLLIVLDLVKSCFMTR